MSIFIYIDKNGTAFLKQSYNAFSEFSLLFFPPMLIVFLLIFLIFVGCRVFHIKFGREYWPFMFAFCCMGVVPGVIAGYSQQAIAGAFLTATIGIVSALLSFAFSKESLEAWRPAIPFAIIALLICSLAGFSSGSVAKGKWLAHDEAVKDRRVYQDQVWAIVEKERQIGNLRALQAASKQSVTIARLAKTNFSEATEPAKTEEPRITVTPPNNAKTFRVQTP